MSCCAARGCKRKVWERGIPDGARAFLCYKHGWYYSCTIQKDYRHLCEYKFPIFSAGDVYFWLMWVGL